MKYPTKRQREDLTKETGRRVFFVYTKGWAVEEKQGNSWVRVWERLTKEDAFWVAYGWVC